MRTQRTLTHTHALSHIYGRPRPRHPPQWVDPQSNTYSYYVTPTVAIAELFRRFMWATIRYGRAC